MIEIQKVLDSDIEVLRSAAISAFLDDERYKPENALPGGPPGHDQFEEHVRWIRKHDYFKCVFHGNIIGGCIVKKHPSHYELYGIFLRSNFIGKGIGSEFLNGVMKMYPDRSPWLLETPNYSKRNHRFYEHNGFTVSLKTNLYPNLGYGFIIYQKPASK
ncbi:GNAT family N-acetyltransferase [uncultured Desulfosarcina sp.]|uniref:GNAT family N-acetyltransferase n=1 Tax=uncultured Desulfosarcina sp. TaxID=218289 RepID=UPI0029C67C8D|nr:GNAT family N-acetyltransferase [uncultured Desulfosarcina sp.]